MAERDEKLMKGAQLATYSTSVKAYARKVGATYFDEFVHGIIEASNIDTSTSITTSETGDKVVFSTKNKVFYLLRANKYYSKWSTNGLYYDGTAIRADRLFVCNNGYIANGNVVTFDNDVELTIEELDSYNSASAIIAKFGGQSGKGWLVKNNVHIGTFTINYDCYARSGIVQTLQCTYTPETINTNDKSMSAATSLVEGRQMTYSYQRYCTKIDGTGSWSEWVCTDNKEDITTLQANIDALIVDISDYMSEGAVLPTANAIFHISGTPIDLKAISAAAGELGADSTASDYLVFGNPNGYVAYKYTKNDTTKEWEYVYYKMWIPLDGDVVPTTILRAFGEAEATETYNGRMSANDKKQVNKIGNLTTLKTTEKGTLVGAFNELYDVFEENEEVKAEALTDLDTRIKGMVINLSEYAQAGKTLPTIRAIFICANETVHYRTIFDHLCEIGEDREYYYVFCVGHDKEIEDEGLGYRYLVYKSNGDFYKDYDLSVTPDEGEEVVNIPDIILRAFGEATATTTAAGLMSKEDKGVVDSVGSVSNLTTTSKSTIVGAVNEVVSSMSSLESSLGNRISSLELLGLKRQIVDVLPNPSGTGESAPKENIIYMLPVRDQQGDYYNEYLWVASKNAYELIGSSKTSLDGYTTDASHNRLLASTVGVDVEVLDGDETIIGGNAISCIISRGDKIKLVPMSGSEDPDYSEDITIKGYSVDTTGVDEITDEFTFKSNEVSITHPRGLLRGTLNIVFKCTDESKAPDLSNVKMFITNNATTNVGIPTLTDAEVQSIFADA